METLYDAHYGYDLSYLVKKEIRDSYVYIHIIETSFGRNNPIRTVKYKFIGADFISPFINWYNVLFCSNEYGPAPDYDYMNRAVQEGRKTAATLYLRHGSQSRKMIRETLPVDCRAQSYDEDMLYVYHKGKLNDYFDFSEIQNVYTRHGVYGINWAKVQDYFKVPISFFGDEEKCGFSLQSGGDYEETIIKGLVLGYPVESTVEYLPHFD